MSQNLIGVNPWFPSHDYLLPSLRAAHKKKQQWPNTKNKCTPRKQQPRTKPIAATESGRAGEKERERERERKKRERGRETGKTEAATGREKDKRSIKKDQTKKTDRQGRGQRPNREQAGRQSKVGPHAEMLTTTRIARQIKGCTLMPQYLYTVWFGAGKTTNQTTEPVWKRRGTTANHKQGTISQTQIEKQTGRS